MSINSRFKPVLDCNNYFNLLQRSKPIDTRHQIPFDTSSQEFKDSVEFLRSAPGLVSIEEIEILSGLVAEAAAGRLFVLQIGDCAERFRDSEVGVVRAKLEFYTEIQKILETGLKKPVVLIARMGGQYAKPRSRQIDQLQGKGVRAFLGEIAHSFEEPKREIDGKRLVLAYQAASTVIANTRDNSSLKLGSNLFFAHEALVLPYEDALIRIGGSNFSAFASSAHFLWIGDKTRNLNGGHIDFIKKLSNQSIGIKLGPSATAGDIEQIISALSGKKRNLCLITRIGANQVNKKLPLWIEAAQKAQTKITWIVDPMHGNTYETSFGVKTRDFAAICAEYSATKKLHAELGSCLSGIHLEASFEEVTECVGGGSRVTEENLTQNYTTQCDPRLNRSQCLEFARFVVEYERCFKS